MQRSRQGPSDGSRPATKQGSRESLVRDTSRPSTTQEPGRQPIQASRAPADLPWRTRVLDTFQHHPSWKTVEKANVPKFARMDAPARPVLPPGWTYREPDPAVQVRPRPLKKPPLGRLHKGAAGRAMPAWADWIETKPERRKILSLSHAVDRVYAKDMVQNAGLVPMRPPPPPPPPPPPEPKAKPKAKPAGQGEGEGAIQGNDQGGDHGLEA